jgi:hypothetical protein
LSSLAFPVDVLDEQLHFGNLANLGFDDSVRQPSDARVGDSGLSRIVDGNRMMWNHRLRERHVADHSLSSLFTADGITTPAVALTSTAILTRLPDSMRVTQGSAASSSGRRVTASQAVELNSSELALGIDNPPPKILNNVSGILQVRSPTIFE